jgi:hypothetical protein
VLASKVLMQGCAWMNWAADFLHRWALPPPQQQQQ